MNIIFKFLFLLFLFYWFGLSCFGLSCFGFIVAFIVACRFNYHPPPNADPNDPPNISFAAMGPNDSVPGLAAPTKGVESC
jgi:hypothetical protein